MDSDLNQDLAAHCGLKTPLKDLQAWRSTLRAYENENSSRYYFSAPLVSIAATRSLEPDPQREDRLDRLREGNVQRMHAFAGEDIDCAREGWAPTGRKP